MFVHPGYNCLQTVWTVSCFMLTYVSRYVGTQVGVECPGCVLLQARHTVRCYVSPIAGNIDNNTFDDSCREILGVHAYMTFTLDKVIQGIMRMVRLYKHMRGQSLYNVVCVRAYVHACVRPNPHSTSTHLPQFQGAAHCAGAPVQPAGCHVPGLPWNLHELWLPTSGRRGQLPEQC